MMGEGGSSVPPHLYNANVLRNAKHQSLKKRYRDSNAISAISKFKRSPEGYDVVRDIGLDPVVVHFWSPHQIRLFNDIAKREHIRLCIDATGGLAKYFMHVDENKSQHIFLYLGVIHCSFGQFAISGMFSECQDTVTISTWLRRWIQSGAKFPKEVVSI